MSHTERMPEWLCRLLLEKQLTSPAEKFQDLQRVVAEVTKDAFRECPNFGELPESDQRVEIDRRLKDCRSVAGRFVYLFAKLFPGESDVLENEARYMLAGHLEIKHGVFRDQFDSMTQLEIVQLLEAELCNRASKASQPQEGKSDFKLPQLAQKKKEKKVDYADRWICEFLKKNPSAYVQKVSDDRFAELACVSKGTVQKTAARLRYQKEFKERNTKPRARHCGNDVLDQQPASGISHESLTETQRAQEILDCIKDQEADDRADAHHLPDNKRYGQRPTV